jgi:hypothetical protein
MSGCCVAGVALDVDDEFTGVVADVDELPDVFVRDVMSRNIRDVMSPNLGDSSRDSAGDSWGDSISCNGYVKDDRDGGSRLYCRSPWTRESSVIQSSKQEQVLILSKKHCLPMEVVTIVSVSKPFNMLRNFLIICCT